MIPIRTPLERRLIFKAATETYFYDELKERFMTMYDFSSQMLSRIGNTEIIADPKELHPYANSLRFGTIEEKISALTNLFLMRGTKCARETLVEGLSDPQIQSATLEYIKYGGFPEAVESLFLMFNPRQKNAGYLGSFQSEILFSLGNNFGE